MGVEDLLVELALLVDVPKVDPNVGFHPRGGHLQHPSGGVKPLSQSGNALYGLQVTQCSGAAHTFAYYMCNMM